MLSNYICTLVLLLAKTADFREKSVPKLKMFYYLFQNAILIFCLLDQTLTELQTCGTDRECCSEQRTVKAQLCFHNNGLGFYVYQFPQLERCDTAYCLVNINELTYRPAASSSDFSTTGSWVRFSKLISTSALQTHVMLGSLRQDGRSLYKNKFA